MAAVERGHHVAHHVLSTNSLTPWLRTHLDTDGTTLIVDAPLAVLGIVPAGHRRTVLELTDVAGIELGWRLHPERALVAVLVASIVAGLDLPAWVAVALGAVAVWLAILSFVAVLRIGVLGDAPIVAPVCAVQRARARRVADRIAWIAHRAG